MQLLLRRLVRRQVWRLLVWRGGTNPSADSTGRGVEQQIEPVRELKHEVRPKLVGGVVVHAADCSQSNHVEGVGQ